MTQAIETFRDLKEFLDEQPEHYLDEPIKAGAKYNEEGEELDERIVLNIDGVNRASDIISLVGRKAIDEDDE